MRNRFHNADAIWNGGACNPRAVARSLVEAIDSATDEGTADNDAAVQMILDHLCFLCGLPQPSALVNYDTWQRVMQDVEAKRT